MGFKLKKGLNFLESEWEAARRGITYNHFNGIFFNTLDFYKGGWGLYQNDHETDLIVRKNNGDFLFLIQSIS